jgi:hypothetical protein
VALNLKRGRVVPCYCFGKNADKISGATLGRLVLLGTAEAFLLKVHEPVYIQNIGFREFEFALFWAVFTLTVGFWFFELRDLVRFFRPMR